MVALLDSLNDRVRLAAARDILDRLLGSALERHEHAGPEGTTLLRGDIDPETLQASLRELMGPSSADA